MLRDYFERRRIKKILSRVVGAEAAERLLRDEKLETTLNDPLKEGLLQYVFLFVRGTPAEISARLGVIGEIAKLHSAMIFTALGPVVALAFGVAPYSPPEPARRLALVEELRRQLGVNARIIHGAAVGYHGLLGSAKAIFSYSFIVPHFDKILAALICLEDGAAEEFVE